MHFCFIPNQSRYYTSAGNLLINLEGAFSYISKALNKSPAEFSESGRQSAFLMWWCLASSHQSQGVLGQLVAEEEDLFHV